MTGINLRVATLKNAKLKNCNLRGATLAGTDLEVREHSFPIHICINIHICTKNDNLACCWLFSSCKLNGVKLLNRVLSQFN